MTDRRATAQVQRLVDAFFCDAAKSALWFETKNPMLGYLRPIDLIYVGKANKLLRIVKLLIEEGTKEIPCG